MIKLIVYIIVITISLIIPFIGSVPIADLHDELPSSSVQPGSDITYATLTTESCCGESKKNQINVFPTAEAKGKGIGALIRLLILAFQNTWFLVIFGTVCTVIISCCCYQHCCKDPDSEEQVTEPSEPVQNFNMEVVPVPSAPIMDGPDGKSSEMLYQRSN